MRRLHWLILATCLLSSNALEAAASNQGAALTRPEMTTANSHCVEACDRIQDRVIEDNAEAVETESRQADLFPDDHQPRASFGRKLELFLGLAAVMALLIFAFLRKQARDAR